MFILFFFCLLNCCFYELSGIVTISLTEWNVTNANKTIKIPAKVPGGIYTDLSVNGILTEDILYRFNDVKFRWVGYDTWTYSCNFKVTKEFLNLSNKELVFNGIDTISTIFINGVHLGNTENMFVRYSFDIQHLLQENNYLEVKIESPIIKAAELFKNSSHFIPPLCSPTHYHGECHINFLRKMQISFSWDFSPAVASVGIWKEVELIGYNEDIYNLDITVSILDDSEFWFLSTVTYIVGMVKSCTHNIILHLENGKDPIVSDVVTVTPFEGTKSVKNILKVPKEKVALWWPNGFGKQRLYNLTSSFINSEFRRNKTINIGFRTVELVQEPVGNKYPDSGLSFYFKINDVPIFAKGTNWIPIDILPEKTANKEKIRNLLEAVKISKVNIIRIWGGGIYESDLFYQYADQYGIMIWQDMMFACSMYPANEEFLSSVDVEITQQIKRLQHHASIVIWVGNNENEAALTDNWYGTGINFPLYREEYIKLYVDTIKPVVLVIDGTRPFLLSSPTNGLETEKEGYIAKNPYDELYGTIHYYNYVLNLWDDNIFKLPRFSDEFGLQSMPSYRSLQTVSIPSDLEQLGTKFMTHRQHLLLGNSYMVLQIMYHFTLPRTEDISYFIYLTQVSQAWAVKTETEWYRRCRNVLLPNGKGLTMGAFYWQLNDVWLVPSWSSIEYNGKWKMLQYYVKKMFAPVLVSPHLYLNGTITVSLISDLLYDVDTVKLVINIYRLDSMIPVASLTYFRALKKESSNIVLSISSEELQNIAPSCVDLFSRNKCLVELQLANLSGEPLSPDNHVFLSRLNDLPQSTVKVTVEKSDHPSNQHNITVEIDTVTLFIWIDTTLSGYFSDNGFIQTASKKNIIFFSINAITYDTLQSDIIVTKLDS